jgi:hypothetical protein
MNAAQENFSNLLVLATRTKSSSGRIDGIRGSIVASSQAAWALLPHLLVLLS